MKDSETLSWLISLTSCCSLKPWVHLVGVLHSTICPIPITTQFKLVLMLPIHTSRVEEECETVCRGSFVLQCQNVAHTLVWPRTKTKFGVHVFRRARSPVTHRWRRCKTSCHLCLSLRQIIDLCQRHNSFETLTVSPQLRTETKPTVTAAWLRNEAWNHCQRGFF